jgi:hypothetical protein
LLDLPLSVSRVREPVRVGMRVSRWIRWIWRPIHQLLHIDEVIVQPTSPKLPFYSEAFDVHKFSPSFHHATTEPSDLAASASHKSTTESTAQSRSLALCLAFPRPPYEPAPLKVSQAVFAYPQRPLRAPDSLSSSSPLSTLRVSSDTRTARQQTTLASSPFFLLPFASVAPSSPKSTSPLPS